MEKCEFPVLIKHCRALVRREQRLRDGMLTLNVVVKTQMMLNTQVVQIRQLSRKTPKNSTNSFRPIVNWSCVRLQRSWRYRKAVYPSFCMNIYLWERYIQSGCCVCSQSIKNKVSMIQSVVCNCFHEGKRSFYVNMWQ